MLYLWKNYEHFDVISDRYLQNSLKENIRNDRGLGSRKMFDDDIRIPSDFKCGFLTNSKNKNGVPIYFEQKFSAIQSIEKSVVATYNDSITTYKTKRTLLLAPLKKQIN